MCGTAAILTTGKPVERSTRATIFPGKRQLDRAAVRRVAEELGWTDADLLAQIGEGGVEVRSDCSLDIVLQFHHDSFFNELEVASKVVEAHIAEEWVSKPTRYLPFTSPSSHAAFSRAAW